MEVSLTETDKVILRYDVPTYDINLERKSSGSELLLTVDDTNVYTTLFHGREMDAGKYEINWRGNIDRCLAKFEDEVGCFENDYQLDVHEAAVERANA